MNDIRNLIKMKTNYWRNVCSIQIGYSYQPGGTIKSYKKTKQWLKITLVISSLKHN